MAAYLGSRLNWKEHGKDWNVADTTQCQSWLSGRFKWMNHQTSYIKLGLCSEATSWSPFAAFPRAPFNNINFDWTTLEKLQIKQKMNEVQSISINAPYCGNFWNCMKWRWCVSEIMIRNEPISCVSKILHRKLAVEIVVHWQHWCKTPRWKRFHRVSSQPDDHHSLWPLRPFVGEGAVQLTSFLL